MAEPCHVLISSAGRRVALLRYFREAIAQLGLAGHVYASDITAMAAAFQEADDRFLVPHCTDEAFIPAMLELCRRRAIRLVVPTIDTELPVYAAHRHDFAAIGTTVAIGGPETIAIGRDKARTHQWLTEQDLPRVAQALPEQVLREPAAWRFPLYAKPVAGSASKGIRLVQNVDELAAATGEGEFIVQEVAAGQEYTLDAFMDAEGMCRCIVPRKRIEVRGGEVSKGQTVRLETIEQLGFTACAHLPDARGAINIQLFHDPDTGRCAIIEINPRFGGGYPLSHVAGARFTHWLLEEVTTGHCTAGHKTWRDGLVMLRYDDAVFVDAGEVRR